MAGAPFNTVDTLCYELSVHKRVQSDYLSNRNGNTNQDRTGGFVDMHIYSPEPSGGPVCQFLPQQSHEALLQLPDDDEPLGKEREVEMFGMEEVNLDSDHKFVDEIPAVNMPGFSGGMGHFTSNEGVVRQIGTEIVSMEAQNADVAYHTSGTRSASP